MQSTNVIQNARFEGDKASKIQVVKTSQLALDALYVKPGQQHGPHRLPERDRAIAIVAGAGTVVIHLEPVEQRIEVRAGDVVLAPKNTWHTVINTSGENMVALLSAQFPVRVEEKG